MTDVPPSTSEKVERPPLLARPIFWMPLAIICIGGAVYKRRGDERIRLGDLWEQRCLGDTRCDANVRKVSDYCHAEVISILRPRHGVGSQRKQYVGCVVSIMENDFSFAIDPPRDLRVNYF